MLAADLEILLSSFGPERDHKQAVSVATFPAGCRTPSRAGSPSGADPRLAVAISYLQASSTFRFFGIPSWFFSMIRYLSTKQYLFPEASVPPRSLLNRWPVR